MPYLLNLVYLLLILLSLPWLLWQAVRKGKYREGYAAKFLGRVPVRTSANSRELTAPGGMHTDLDGRENASGTAPGAVSSRLFQPCEKTCLWLHAVSVGEVNLLAPLLKMIEQERPEWECVISTTTNTGMALAKKKYPKNTVFYCPLDFSWAVGAAMRRIRPDVLVLAELELWPNLIRAAKRHGAKVAVINGRLGEKSFRGYRRIRPLVAGLMRQIDLLAVQDETYADRFRTLGARPETVHVTGSMKYDGAQTDRSNPTTRRLAALAGFADGDIVLLAGSTQEPEEAIVLETFRTLSPQWPRLRLVLVPRHPDRFEAVAKLLDSSGIPWQRRTALSGETASGGHAGDGVAVQLPPQQGATTGRGFVDARILLVDVIGELGAWWGTAHIAFVGGSMGSRGGQNMIEPAAYGAAVSFGPNTWNFRDIVAAMHDHDAAVVVHDGEQFTRFVRHCLDEPEYAAMLGNRARALVLEQLGATEKTFRLLGDLCCGGEGTNLQTRSLNSPLARRQTAMQNAGSPLDAKPVSVPSSRWWQNRWEALGWILLAGLLVGFFPFVLRRLTRLTSSDFWLFYDSAQYIWEHGARAPKSKFLHYLPSVDVAFVLLAWMPMRWAAVTWFGIMTSGWLCLLAAVHRYLLCDYDATQARQSVLCAGLIVMPLFLDHLCVGAFHVLMVWFMVAGLGRTSQNKPWSGGMMLGLAVWIKLLPLVGVGYLLLKRKWLPAAVALAAALAVDLALSLAAFGPQGTWESHCLWLESEVFGARNALLTDPNPLDDDRITNQSVMVVMRHTLTHMGHGSPADRNEAEAARLGIKVKPGQVGSVKYGLLRPNVSVADLTPGQLQAAYTAVMLLLLLAISIYCRRPGSELLPRQWSTEIALIVLATLWFSPLVWSYHPTAAVPALAMIFVRAPQHSKLALAVAALWLVSLALMGSPTARVLGVTLWTNLLLGGALVWTAYGEAPNLAEA